MSSPLTPERSARINAIWREVMTWPVRERMSLVVSVCHGTLDDAGQAAIDAGLFDSRAKCEVYAVSARGPMARDLKEKVRELLLERCGTRQVIQRGQQPTPMSEPDGRSRLN